MKNRWCGFFIACALFLLASNPVWAQSGLSARLSRPDTEAFPLATAYLDIKNGLGQFVHGLQADALNVLEDGLTVPVAELVELRPGAQLVVAVNPGPPFALRNSQGLSRSAIIQRTLQDWAKSRQGSSLDDLSLIVTNSNETTHLNDPLEWSTALDLDQIDARQAKPSLDTLSRAVEIAADQPVRDGMGRAVLFITTPLEDQTEVAIQDLLARAQELGVSISIWMVPVPGAFYPNAEKQFQLLTSQTGGQLFTYTDEAPSLDLEALLDPFRSIYRLAYSSQIRSGGSHQLAVDIQTPDGPLTTPLQAFDLNLLPPEPAFVSPPLEIRRTPPATEDGKPDPEAPFSEYLPGEQEIEILVAFPDERPRSLVRTSLYVDGVLVQENTRAPLERFTWNIKDYPASGQHLIRVEAQDELGLVGISIERLVQLTIAQPARNPWSWVFRNAPTLSILGAVVAGAVLLLVLLLGGRVRPRQPGLVGARRRKSDPVTQPVPVRSEAPQKSRSNWADRLRWPQRQIPPQAYAFLSRISDTDSQETATPIPITVNEITLGSDPNLATLVLNNLSVEGLHARLLRKEDGSFRLNDEGSIAGTWVNYSPISREGAGLEHGDLIHIGQVGFRFTTRQPGPARKAVVSVAKSP